MAVSLRLGTRGSALALWQANMVAERLRAHAAESPDVEIVVIKTTGDQRQDIPLGEMAGKGVFVREIEAALLRGDIDLAVHSAKDLQSSDPAGLTLAAFCERANPHDAFVSPHGSFSALPRGSRVATGSPRRVAQLKHLRPDLRFVEIRGNVDTRLSKLAKGEADALILAAAGLIRLNRADVITEYLSPEICLPQVGQACVAVQCRVNDNATKAIVAASCNHAPTQKAVKLERAFLALVGGGCTAPVAAHSKEEGGTWTLEGLAASREGTTVLREKQSAALESDIATLPLRIYEALWNRGAGALLTAV